MVRTGRVGVGVVGAGVISGTYLENMTAFPDLEVLFVADLILGRAQSQAQKYGIAGHGSVAELLAIDEIEIVVNLTTPDAHTEISEAAIAAGKHVWSEKPIALDHGASNQLLARARAKGLRVACAPDTVLGAGIQTALRGIARGDIGVPLTATTIFQVPGPEAWHPAPQFLYAYGAGPLFDMGPYYITTLVHALGGITEVSAVSSKSVETRVIASGPLAGTEFPVEVPTHYGALLKFAGGQSAQSTFSFQSALPRAGFVEISGTEGTLVLPDPNTFEGDTQLWRCGFEEPETIAAQGSTYGRGSGVLDLARSIRGGGAERASGEVAAHVLDVLLAVSSAASSGQPVAVTSEIERPTPLPVDWNPAEPTLS